MTRDDPPPPAPLRVCLLPLPRFTLTPFALFVDVLRLAADEADLSRQKNCRWRFHSFVGSSVAASCGTVLQTEGRPPPPAAFDYVVVVGGILHGGETETAEMRAWLRGAAEAGVTLVGLCTGSFALARAGLMQGRRCCVNWFHLDDFRLAFADVEPVADRIFVADGRRITCGGGTAALDVAAWIVERHLGAAAAQKALRVLLADRARGAGEAQPPGQSLGPANDPRVRRAVLLMEQNLAEPLTTDELAARLNLSVRHLERLFLRDLGVTPARLYLDARLQLAAHLLETTGKRVTEIAMDAGFVNLAHFATRFRARFGVAPSRYRAEKAAAPPREAQSSSSSPVR